MLPPTKKLEEILNSPKWRSTLTDLKKRSSSLHLENFETNPRFRDPVSPISSDDASSTMSSFSSSTSNTYSSNASEDTKTSSNRNIASSPSYYFSSSSESSSDCTSPLAVKYRRKYLPLTPVKCNVGKYSPLSPEDDHRLTEYSLLSPPSSPTHYCRPNTLDLSPISFEYPHLSVKYSKFVTNGPSFHSPTSPLYSPISPQYTSLSPEYSPINPNCFQSYDSLKDPFEYPLCTQRTYTPKYSYSPKYKDKYSYSHASKVDTGANNVRNHNFSYVSYPSTLSRY